MELSPLQKARLAYEPVLPVALKNIQNLDFEEVDQVACDPRVRPFFPSLCKAKTVRLIAKEASFAPLRVGVVLSGGQAPGGHNVIAGIFDALMQFHEGSRLIGFCDGPQGIVKNKSVEITHEFLAPYRNQGGFDMIGSGRTKIETPEQFEKALQTVQAHNLDGLVVIGGDDSNTNAAFLAEYFLKQGQKTCVVGVPKTIDGDLKNEAIEISFGFDSACKVYADTIGNIARDAISAKKYYYFIKLMGRSASHITLECAMKSHPNLALIAEEAEAKGWQLQDVVDQIVTLIEERAKAGKEYGVILIPEGIIEFLPDMKALILALNKSQETPALKLLPPEILEQLSLDRDPHGNVQVSKIETERLFIHLVNSACKKKNLKFSGQAIFCGYEGRSCMPSNFDANYCYSLGQLAALVAARKRTGYIVSFQGLPIRSEEWTPLISPLISMLHLEEREGKEKAVIQKALVDLQGDLFQKFCKERESWKLGDAYSQPGPIQFYGPKELTDSHPLTIKPLAKQS